MADENVIRLHGSGVLQGQDDPRRDPGYSREEPLHPVVQLKFGTEDFVVTIPPEYIQEMTVVSKYGAEESNFVFIDPTFGRLEHRIFETEREGAPVLYRWGYPGNGLEDQFWGQLQIVNYTPTITNTGIRISLDGKAVGSEFATLAEPKVYRGKISDVITTIAKEMGFDDEDIYVEETDDDFNDVRDQPWPTGNKTRIDLINYMLQFAKSKSHPNRSYDFRLSLEGSFHFHTQDYEQAPKSEKSSKNLRAYRTFNVLYGVPTGVESFTPRYSAKTLGNFARQVIAGTFDPRTKQFIQRTLNRSTLGMTGPNDLDKGRTSGGPISKDTDTTEEQRRKNNAYMYATSKQVGIGGRCAGKATEINTAPDQALNKQENAWKRMQRALMGGTLELVGLPEYASLSARDLFYDINVVLPELSDIERAATELGLSVEARERIGLGEQTRLGGQQLHWSSGRYHIATVTHMIATGYRITVELDCFMHLEGPDDAKTGPPRKPLARTVKVR